MWNGRRDTGIDSVTWPDNSTEGSIIGIGISFECQCVW